MKINSELKPGYLGIFWNHKEKLFGAKLEIKTETFPTRDLYKFLAAVIRTMIKEGLDIGYDTIREVVSDSEGRQESKILGIKFFHKSKGGKKS